MPRINGFQTLHHLNNSERLSSIPVVIYTTSRAESDKEESLRPGAMHFITKPDSIAKIKNELKEVFSADWFKKK